MVNFKSSFFAAYLDVSLESPFPEAIDEICKVVEANRRSSRGISATHRANERNTAIWFTNSLLQAFEAIPEVALAVPRSESSHSPGGPLHGITTYAAITNVIKALESMNWIEVTPGFQDPNGLSFVSRFCAANQLRRYFDAERYQWRRLVQSAQPLVRLTTGSKNERREVRFTETDETRQMNFNLHRFNEFLLDQSIYLQLCDSRLYELGNEISRNWGDNHNHSKEAVNFRRVCLRRIFSRGRFDRGGRFYGGWWQNVPSRYRRHLCINGHKTKEYDFSAMSLSLLYAREGLGLPEGDLYDIGLSGYAIRKEEKRGVLKRFVNAWLNTDARGYRLDQEDTSLLGASNEQIRKLLFEKHAQIAHYFGADVGMELQYIDSMIAERVMLTMMDDYSVPVLPIHDSFITRSSYGQILETVMREAALQITGEPIRIKFEEAVFEPSWENKIVDGVIEFDSTRIDEYLQSHRIAHKYFNSNPNAHLS